MEDGSRLGQGHVAVPVGDWSGVVWPRGVASATAIMQLELQQSFLFMILEVPQIQFNPECRTFQMHAERAAYGVRRSCEPQRHVSAVHFRRGCTVPKTVGVFKGSVREPSSGTMLVRQWMHDLRRSWVLLNVFTHFLRQGGTSDSEVYLVLLSSRGVEKCAQSVLQLACRGGCTWKFGHYLHEPLWNLQSFVRRQGISAEDFLEPSSALSCECSRAGGVPESPGVVLPGDSAHACTI